MNIAELKTKRSTMKDRKSNAYKVCTLLLGEAETAAKRSGKEPDIVAIATKMLKSNNEVLQIKPSVKLVEENVFLTSLLPKQMSEEEITQAIKESGSTNIGDIMKYLNSNYSGMFDRKLASKIAKQ